MRLKLLTVQLLWFYSNDFPSDELLLLRAEWSVCVDTCRVSESAADYQLSSWRETPYLTLNSPLIHCDTL